MNGTGQKRKLPIWFKALLTAIAAALCAAGSCLGFFANMNRPGDPTGKLSGAFAIAFVAFCAATLVAVLVAIVAAIIGMVRAARKVDSIRR